NSCIKPIVFLQVQQIRASLRQNYLYTRNDTSYIPQQVITVSIVEDYRYSRNPVLSLETTLGAGFIVDVTQQFSLKLSAGISAPFIFDNEMNGTSVDGFSSFAEAGLIWRFGKTAE
ncbi:MAG: hypothetical protein ACRC3B_00400, partial [Bacteroidia bacterium]